MTAKHGTVLPVSVKFEAALGCDFVRQTQAKRPPLKATICIYRGDKPWALALYTCGGRLPSDFSTRLCAHLAVAPVHSTTRALPYRASSLQEGPAVSAPAAPRMLPVPFSNWLSGTELSRPEQPAVCWQLPRECCSGTGATVAGTSQHDCPAY